jgi:hypothetical protein
MAQPGSLTARRLSALEQLAEEVRTRPVRRMIGDLAHDQHWSPAQTEVALASAMEAIDRYTVLVEGLKRRGYSERQVLEHVAGLFGLAVEQLEATCERLAGRYLT